MTNAGELMTPGAECIGTDDTVRVAAKKMADLKVGALPICGTDQKLKGMLTDRDIVVKVLATGGSEDTRAGDVLQGEIITVTTDTPAEEILQTMSAHQVRRLPVLDHGNLVGIVAQADVARSMSTPSVGDLVAAVSDD